VNTPPGAPEPVVAPMARSLSASTIATAIQAAGAVSCNSMLL